MFYLNEILEYLERYYMYSNLFFVTFLCFSPIVFSTDLHRSVEQENLEIVRTLIAQGVNVNAVNSDGHTLLHVAAYYGHLNVVIFLLGAGAQINVVNGAGYTPLHLAAHDGHLNVVSFLLGAGVQINAVSGAGYTPLHVAAHYGHLNVVQSLIGVDAQIDAANGAGYTPLHMAVQSGHLTIVDYLLGAGAQINAVNVGGDTPLHMGAHFGYPVVVQTLLDAGADLTQENLRGNTAQVGATLECAEVILGWLDRQSFLRKPLMRDPLRLLDFRGSPGNFFFNAQLKESHVLLGVMFAMHSLSEDIKWMILKFLTFGDFFVIPKGSLKKHRDDEDDGKGGQGGARQRAINMGSM